MATRERLQIGGDAFPTPDAQELGTVGLSALDYFAAAALTGVLANSKVHPVPELIAAAVYDTAEAMLTERDKRNDLAE